MSGKFIVIEGLEGAGKSSAVNIVEHCLKEANKGFIKVREPGGTPLAEALRELIKQPWQERVCAESEVLVMYAARMQLVRNVIEPALGKGEWVIGDRHDLSSQAYQGGGRELSYEMMQQLRDMTLGTFKPDLTLYLDIDPLLGLERAKGRGTLDRIEQENIEFFQRTRSRYLALAKADEDIETIDAAQSIEQVQADIRQRVQRFIKRQT